MERLQRSAALVPLGFETLTVSTSSIGFASIPSKARIALVTVDTQPVRVSFSGDPTSTTGTRVYVDGQISVDSRLESFRAIRDTTSTASATLTIHYFGASVA